MVKWEKTLVLPSTSVRETIKVIDESSLQIAIVVDKNDVLLGTVTDGDVRRGILKGISLDSEVVEIMNQTPVIAHLGDERNKILTLLKKHRIHQIPIVDQNGIVQSIEFLDELIQTNKYDNWIVLMAGGLGTRLRPLTENIPKPLLKVGSKPILETILESFIENGFHRFYISVNYRADLIEEYFGDGSKWGVEIRYLYENKRLGTAGALSLIPEEIKESIIVMNGDLLTKVNFKQLLDFHQNENADATMCVREYHYQVPYGVVNVNKQKLLSIEEKPISTYFVNAGIYVIEPHVLTLIPADSFYDMPNLFEALINKERETAAFPIREYWLDIGQFDDYEKANKEFNGVFR